MDELMPIAHPDDQAAVEQAFQDLFAGIGPFNLEFRFIRQDNGEVRIAHVICELLRDHSGRPVKVLGVAQDITKWRQAEEAMRDSEAFLRKVLKSSLCAIYVYDVELGTHSYINPKYEAMFGYILEDIRSMAGQKIFALVHPDDASRFVRHFEQVARSADGEVLEIEYRFRTADGRWHWILGRDSVFTRNAGGAMRQLIGSALDITERKLAEEALGEREQEFRRVLETSATGLVRVSSDMHYRWVNPAYARLVGVPLEAIIGKSMAEVVGEQALKIYFPYIQRVLRGEQVEYETEICYLSGPRFVHVVTTPDEDETGRVAGWFASLTDITERWQVEEALRQSREHLAERSRLVELRATQLQRLAAELGETEERERRKLAKLLHGHFQQILIAVKTALRVTQKKLVDQKLSDGLEYAQKLLDEALKQSRILTAELSPLVLNDQGLAAALHWLGRQSAERLGVEVSVEAEEVSVLKGESLESFLFEAARELIVNAVKHGRARNVAIKLSRTAGQLVCLSVADDGQGCEAQALEGPRESGGFGLFSIRERLDVLGGKLEIESSPGQGMTVSISVSGKQRHRKKARLSSEASEPPDRSPAKGPRLRVVLADDHAMVRKGLADTLAEEPGIELVGEAGDGREAVDLALQLRPDVVVMDVSMPGMDGIEATRRIKEAAPEIRIIGLSMHERGDMEATMKSAGASDYLEKSAALDELIALLLGKRCDP